MGMDGDEGNKVSQNRFMGYMEAMHNAYEAMSEDEKEELHAWEQENLGDPDRPDVGTSDWPGWRRYLGPPPWRREDWPHQRP